MCGCWPHDVLLTELLSRFFQGAEILFLPRRKQGGGEAVRMQRGGQRW